MSKKDTVEVTQGFLEYQNAELGKLRERLHGMRAKLRQAEAEKVELQRSLELLRRDNERLSNALRIKDGKLRGKCADLNMARKDPCGTLRARIECAYATSRERALALTKLDECEMWLGRCEPKETAAPTLKGAAQDAAMPCLKDDIRVELKPEMVAETVAKSLRESVQPALRMAVE